MATRRHMGIHTYTVSEAQNLQLGHGGYDIVTNATVNSDTYIAITILTGSTDDGKNSTGSVTATSVDTGIWDSLSTLAVPTGTTIHGRWSSVTIASGDTAIVYRG